MLHPGLSKLLDFPDIAGITAPRPIAVSNGGKNKLFPHQAVKHAYQKLHQIWKSQHADNRLKTKIRPKLGHIFYAEQQTLPCGFIEQNSTAIRQHALVRPMDTSTTGYPLRDLSKINSVTQVK
ncbi:MAG: hypothetical protein CENE_02593 [Candidatus Celerinatantimonas neptuna]|nr:MAG: hypothetical protein CENE_02593 [Candidatus Celerinatantimonas neptuna]